MKIHVNVTLYISRKPIALVANYMADSDDFYDDGNVMLIRKEGRWSMRKFKRHVMRLINNEELLRREAAEKVSEAIASKPVKKDDEILLELDEAVKDKGFMFEMDV